MSLYFFDVDGLPPDEDGTNISKSNLSAVAVRAAGEMIRESTEEFWKTRQWEMRVRDEAGHQVLKLRFLAERSS